MTIKSKFTSLKEIDIQSCYISLAIVQEYKKKRISHYNVKYVQIDKKLENRLKNIVARRIEGANSIEKYSYDCPEPEEDQIRAIDSGLTDFEKIMEALDSISPEEDTINSVDDLVKAKSYIIILRDSEGIKVIAFKRIPENWKMKKEKGYIPLLYKENMFVDLEEDNVFSISNSIDFMFYDDLLFILSKKAFETGMNFREGMMAKADEFYQEEEVKELFVNMDILTNKVGNNQRYLRKIATIKNLGYYKDQNFLNRFKEVNKIKNWGVNFQDGQIVITEESLEDILTILQNKRLHSDLTEEDFDVESVKPLDAYKGDQAQFTSKLVSRTN
ncbi:Kiwa anti-phage protein KwaB-like domain-containing protein [Echinicola shivajiensis]|uniref:Kiwa anti-phage protein KwaB-like domain-containing protein n=1 Tax=Echinicola shivajiensis TaxID=1035916 RepID=UPI001BFCAC43|nr:Kiwa anti-phage protein KwaB-like domain-containing protein [Echinicola shivajiensis]